MTQQQNPGSSSSSSELELELAAAGVRDAKPTDTERVQALQQENAAFLQANDPNVFARGVQQRHDQQRQRRRRRTALLLAPALACAALLLVVVDDGPRDRIEVRPPHDDGALRVKGEPTLTGALIRPAGPVRIDATTRGRPGDVVQLRVDGGGDVVVVSFDGRGAITLHHPQRPGAALGPRGLVPSSFELDDAPGFERFIAVIGAGVDVDVVMAAARAVAGGADADVVSLPISSSLTQRSLLVVKEHAP